MGCYDTVNVPCPKCGTTLHAQSKGGDCLMRWYELDNCPPDVLSDVNRHAPFVCTCGAKFKVEVETKCVTRVKLCDLTTGQCDHGKTMAHYLGVRRTKQQTKGYS